MFKNIIESTPFIKGIIPNTVTPNSMTTWRGIWWMTNSLYVKNMKIGNFNCLRFTLADSENPGLKNLNDDTDLNSNAWD